MKRKQLAAAFVGVVAAAIGLLWILQSAGIFQLCPVFCVMDCECLTSGSQFWEARGAIVFIIGIVIAGIGVRRVLKREGMFGTIPKTSLKDLRDHRDRA